MFSRGYREIKYLYRTWYYLGMKNSLVFLYSKYFVHVELLTRISYPHISLSDRLSKWHVYILGYKRIMKNGMERLNWKIHQTSPIQMEMGAHCIPRWLLGVREEIPLREVLEYFIIIRTPEKNLLLFNSSTVDFMTDH